uniref:MULE transposase domain-containing protein n=1 Tax=Lactuca sativa TaxID=4236 RepID=A0A9R1WUA6_LACSA|nr:hypothetical protein LSAT_V11C900472990 [Lactuca sativa]
MFCFGNKFRNSFKSKGFTLKIFKSINENRSFLAEILGMSHGMLPVTYAIVEAENLKSWSWFLECLGEDLDLPTTTNFSFISDRQKVPFKVIIVGIVSKATTILGKYLTRLCMILLGCLHHSNLTG